MRDENLMNRNWQILLIAMFSLIFGTCVQAKEFAKTSGFYVTMPKSGTCLKQIGTASWYGKEFHGKKTASGDKFNLNQFTAAHNSLPLGGMAVVTNLQNQRSIKVVINDRGPFVGNRVIDLSKKAADALGFSRQGIAKVKIEYLHRESNLRGGKLAQQQQHIKEHGSSFYVQPNKGAHLTRE